MSDNFGFVDEAWRDEPTQPGVGSEPLNPVDFQLSDYPRFVLVQGPLVSCYLCARRGTNLTYQMGPANYVYCCPSCALGPPMDLNPYVRRELENMLNQYAGSLK